MLTIPDEVKALFSSDTVRKNFHVRFPNGEYTDLNNEDIISESVQFTESLCSQQYFKFGLAEASQIEFVAVGIPNVRGAYIECAIEIDCTRLGDAWAAAHLPDLTLPFLTAQTCFYNTKLYYRVPYGRFKIDTCPRNHGAMYQRQITAYSDIVHNNEQMSVHEYNSLNTFMPNVSKYSFNIRNFVYGAFGRDNDSVMSEVFNGIDTTLAVSDVPVPSQSQTLINKKGDVHEQYMLWYRIGYKMFFLGDSSTAAKDAVYSAYYPNINFAPLETLLDYYDGKYAFDSVSFKSTYWFMPSVCVSYGQDATTFPSTYNFAPLLPNNDCIYAYREKQLAPIVYLPYYLELSVLSVDGTSVIEPPQTIDLRNDVVTNFLFREWEPTTPTILDDLKVNITSTLNRRKAENVKTKMYSYANAFSFTDYTTGFMELCGWFLKSARNGSLSFFQLSDNPTAIAVSASDWSSFWWDETPIDSIGLVNVIYTQDGEEQQQSFEIGDGNSVYTIENNEVLKSAELDETTMQSILTTYFEPNASVVNFTPVELEMRGLPYLESGDYIELTAEDGETVQTYILNQTISGIQNLRADVTSTTGNLLEVREDE